MKKRTNELVDSWNEILKAEKIVISCHVRPDGDALGSSLALAHVLKACNKNVTFVSPDGVGENYDFIEESNTVVSNTDERDFDLGILVDCENTNRIGNAVEIITSAKRTACIDHHIPDGMFGDIRIVDPKASATAEVLCRLFEENNVEIDQICASQLLTGLIADTGAFRFANTTADTFRIAADLTQRGASPSQISRNVYDNKPLRALKLLGKTLDSIQTDPDGFVAWAVITLDDFNQYSTSDSDTDSIVNQVGAIRGPKVSILFREIEPKLIRVSLRSRGGVDVNKVARLFDGGGHAAAAGCTIYTSLQEAEKVLIDEVLKWKA